MFSVPESFSASRASGGERTREVSAAKASLSIGATNVFVQKSGVEAVARTDRDRLEQPLSLRL